MTERDAETIHKIREFQRHTAECAVQMINNALYIQKELPNVVMSDELRQRTIGLCSTLMGTKHDLITELFELDERMQSGASNAEVLRRIDRMVRWAEEDALQMHEVVMELGSASEKDVMKVGAYLLVSESAVNILRPLNEMRQLAAQLQTVLNEVSQPV
jgi:hypothetical protein